MGGCFRSFCCHECRVVSSLGCILSNSTSVNVCLPDGTAVLEQKGYNAVCCCLLCPEISCYGVYYTHADRQVVCLSLCVCLSVWLSDFLTFWLCLSACRLSVYLPVSVSQSIGLFVFLLVVLLLYMSVFQLCLSACLPICSSFLNVLLYVCIPANLFFLIVILYLHLIVRILHGCLIFHDLCSG